MQASSSGARLSLVSKTQLLPTPRLGASIAVQGVCLTVAEISGDVIAFDVIGETLDKTTLGALKSGDHVNLEPSLRMGDSMDGHIVQGHVDGTARIATVRQEGEWYVIWIEVDPTLVQYIIPKGSIAIDGVSLTVADIDKGRFSIALIPTTLDVTTLGRLKPGDRVNIETDIIARTIVTTIRRWREGDTGGEITLAALQEHGFV